MRFVFQRVMMVKMDMICFLINRIWRETGSVLASFYPRVMITCHLHKIPSHYLTRNLAWPSCFEFFQKINYSV